MKVIIALLLLPMLANAEHHRDHALMHLDAAMHQSRHIVLNLDAYAPNAPEAKSIRNYVAGLQSFIRKAHGNLRTPGSDLQLARGYINQPHAVSSPNTALWRIATTLRYARHLSDDDPYNAATYQALLTNIMDCWSALDRALWHINDAIGEEQ